jgi:hypothetical protein
MASTTNRNRRAATSSGAALAAVMLAAPALAAPPVEATAQSPAPASRSSGYEKQTSATRSVGHIKFKSEYKHKDDYSVAGVGDGHIVFEDERGKLFYVDDASGDQQFVSRDYVVKLHKDWSNARAGLHKMMSTVHIVGVDQDGRTIMSNAVGETFTLDAATGDMIFVRK